MKVSVIHPSLNVIGGSEQVCLSLLESLVERGHNVSLGTFERTDWERLRRFFGKVSRPKEEIVCSRRFGMFAYGETVNFYLLTSKMPEDSDIVLVSCTSPWFYAPQAKMLIMYMLPLLPFGEPERAIWRLYLKPYLFVQRRLLNRVKNKMLLTNSSFSAEIIANAYSICPQVLFPPVNTRMFYPSKKENLVVSTGRFVSEKRFEILVEAFSGIEKDVRCIIMGSIYGNRVHQSRLYVARLRKMIESFDLSDRVELLVNCPFDLLIETLSRARVYVHCLENEPFGISVVESMAAGCVPVVHRSGGAYHDVIDHDKYGFSFETISELSNVVNFLMEKENGFEEYSKRAVNRSMCFDKRSFEERVISLVEGKTVFADGK